MLPEILLDDLRFQELVSEARTRIVRHSPDWTEHNVSDPGITLIELFAWLTEILVYRINRIPERLQRTLLEKVARGTLPRVPGTAIFLSRYPDGVPMTLLHNIKHNKVLHERVVILTVTYEETSRLGDSQRTSQCESDSLRE